MRKGDALHDLLNRFFADTLHLEIPSDDTDLFETSGLDSLSFVELLLQLERQFGLKVSIEELEIENFRSIDKIAEFVRNRIQGEQRDDAPVRPQRLSQDILLANQGERQHDTW